MHYFIPVSRRAYVRTDGRRDVPYVVGMLTPSGRSSRPCPTWSVGGNNDSNDTDVGDAPTNTTSGVFHQQAEVVDAVLIEYLNKLRAQYCLPIQVSKDDACATVTQCTKSMTIGTYQSCLLYTSDAADE